MKTTDIKRYLKTYSITENRKTTINNAFASALSVADNFVIEDVNKAIKLLDQNPEKNLICVYCDKPANTWDHVKAIVVAGEFSGYGHQINNLIPCCKECNSAKGNKDWKEFISKTKQRKVEKKIARIEKYIKNNSINYKKKLKSKAIKGDYIKYTEIKNKVLELLKKADKQAEVIREKLKSSSK
jgi:5-methylcytosine-specific restriction endonuclease McrA